MSRARPIRLPDGTEIWFDQNQNGKKASASQLAWLAAAENTPIDSLLDEGLSQGQVLFRLRQALEPGTIPLDIIERRRKAREDAKKQPACRICSTFDWECDGEITRHHFVPRWMMLELENYQAYAARSKCTIPICIGRHRDLHLDNDEETPKSLAQFMTDDERAFAHKMLEELEFQHPAMFKFIRQGGKGTYEQQLLADFDADLFAKSELDLDRSNFDRSMTEATIEWLEAKNSS
jgi:hypothetical protein